jgi:hypothetical protein
VYAHTCVRKHTCTKQHTRTSRHLLIQVQGFPCHQQRTGSHPARPDACMYECMHVYMYVCMCQRQRILLTARPDACTFEYMHIYTYICVYVYMCQRLSIFVQQGLMPACMSVCMFTCMHVCANSREYSCSAAWCLHVCVCMFICMYVCANSRAYSCSAAWCLHVLLNIRTCSPALWSMFTLNVRGALHMKILDIYMNRCMHTHS